jgi:hypothetical protein
VFLEFHACKILLDKIEAWTNISPNLRGWEECCRIFQLELICARSHADPTFFFPLGQLGELTLLIVMSSLGAAEPGVELVDLMNRGRFNSKRSCNSDGVILGSRPSR